MGLACCPLSAPDLLEEFRAMVRKAADQWVDGFAPLFEQDTAPGLFALSEHVQSTRLDFLGECMKAAVEKLYASYLEQEWAHCPFCDKRLHRKRVESKAISTAQGQFLLGRPYFYCSECSHGFYPLDEALGLAPGHHQYDVQKRVTLTAAEVPFKGASELLEQLTGLRVGDSCAHDTLTAVAQSATIDLVIPAREEIERRIAQAAGEGGTELPILVVSSDGAHGRTRPKAPRKGKRGQGQYKEIKGFRIYLLTPDDRVISVASWHEFQDSDTLGKALEVAASRIPQDRVRVCLIGDGASWVWTEMVRCFPNAKKILDFYHCFEHLHVVARSQYGQGEEAWEGRHWAEINMIRLCQGDTTSVIASTRRLEPRHEDAKEEIRKLIVYLENNADKIHYFQDIEDGYPAGSGGMESANKFICHTRMKRSGAWWVMETGNDMLRIRCAVHNGTFDRVFEHYMASTVSSTRRRKPRRVQNE